MPGTGLPTGGDRRAVILQPAPIYQLGGGANPAAGALDGLKKTTDELLAALDGRQRAEIDAEVTKAAIDLYAQHPEDPQALERVWKEYSDTTLANVDRRHGEHAMEVLNRRGLSIYSQAVQASMAKTKRLSQDAINTQIEASSTEAAAAAGLGNMEGALRATEAVGGYLADGVKAGLWSPEHAAVQLEQVKANTQLEAAIGHVRNTFWTQGADVARRAIDTDILQNPTVALKPAEKERFQARANAVLRELEHEATSRVLAAATGQDPLKAYGDVAAGRAGKEMLSPYAALSTEGKIKVRRELLSLAGSQAEAADRAERRTEKLKQKQTNQLLYSLYDLDPSAPDYLEQRDKITTQVRALGTVAPDTFKAITEANRNAGTDNPELLFSLEDQVEKGTITSADALTRFVGRGLSFETARRLAGKVNNVTDERYRTGLSRLRAEAGLVEGGLFQPNSAEAKAASRMRIAYDDELDTLRRAGETVDPVEVAKRVAERERNRQNQKSADPLIQQYRTQLKDAADKVRAAGITDGQGNRIALEFDSADDIEAARRLSDPNSGLLGFGKRNLFSEKELRQLRTAIQRVHED